MNNTYKAILGLTIAIAIIGGIYASRPKIEVTAEATANATSTVIVPTSTRIVSRETSSTTADVATSAPQITYVYKETVREVQAEKPVEVIGNAGSMIDNAPITELVPAPVFTTPTIIVNPTPVTVNPTPITVNPVIVQPEPVIEPIVEPEVKPTFIEWPRAWVEARNNGDWLFFEGKWDTGELGVIKCNGVYYDKSVQSGFYKVIQVAGSKMSEEPPGTYFTCDFTVGDMGGTTLNYVTK